MKRSELRGCPEVFSFTLVQTVKNKSYIIFTVLMLVFGLASIPLLQAVQNGGDEEITETAVKKVYVCYDWPFDEADFSELQKDAILSAVAFETSEEEIDALCTHIEEAEPDALVLSLSMQEGLLFAEYITATDDTVGTAEVQYFADRTGEWLKEYKKTLIGVSEEQLAMIAAEIHTQIAVTDITGAVVEEKDTSISEAEFGIVNACLFVVMMVIMIAGSQVSMAIVSDKATRVSEYLLVSVRPMALVLGKILAMLIASVGQIVLLVAAMLLSNRFLQKGKESILEQFLPEGIWSHINPLNLLLALVIIVLGFLFFAMLAGIAGATVSRIEELSEGLTLFTVAAIIGLYMAIFAAESLMFGGDNLFVTITLLCPLSSPFLLPGALLIGKASVWYAGISALLLLVFVWLLFGFAANIYEMLITHSGNVIKPKELFGIYRSSKKNRKARGNGGES